jgi:hypothetical protein
LPVLPALVFIVFGQAARGFAAGLGALLALTLLTYLVDDWVVQDIARVAAIVAWALIGVAVIVYATRRLRGALGEDTAGGASVPPAELAASQRAPQVKESSPGLKIAGLLAAAIVLGWLAALVTPADYLKVSGVTMFVLAPIPLLYTLWLGVVQLSLSGELRRRFRGPREDVVDQASKYMAERLGLKPVRPAANAVGAIEKPLRRLFDFTYPPSRLKRTAPFHHFLSEIFDRDEPPMCKNYLELEVREARLPGRGAELRIRSYGVSGVPVGSRTMADDGLDTEPIAL